MTAEYLIRLDAVRPAMVTEGPTDEEARHLSDHFAYLQRLGEDGRVILAGRTTGDEVFGLVIIAADDERSAQAVVDDDPAVANGLMRATLHPYRVAVTGQRR